MKKALRLAILISGSGTTMEAIIKACKFGKLKEKIDPVVVISSNSAALGIEKAKKLGIKVEVVKNRKNLLKTLKKYKPDIVSQNGWLPLTPIDVIRAYKNRIYNQHPAPLDPKNHLHFGGKGMYGLAVHAKILDFQKRAGRNFPTEATIHRVSKEFDTGEVIARKQVPVYMSDTPEILAKRVLPIEHKLFIDFLDREYKGLNKVQTRKSTLIKKGEEEFLYPHKVLILGTGGREDALRWKLKQSPYIDKVYISKDLEVDINNPKSVLKTCGELGITFVVVGSDEPAQHGVVDYLIKEKIEVFGPTKKAAIIEGSKVFSDKFVKRHKIPHPSSKTFSSYKSALKFLNSDIAWIKNGVVIKADGLALGKGAVVCDTTSKAKEVLKNIMVDKQFANAGSKVVIQQKLKGFEVSVTVISDGKNYLVLPFTEDHKQAYDRDLGPNTGGMGVVAPHPLVNKKLADKIIKKIVKPTINGLRREGREFKGVLYPGLMIVDGNPYVLEYNARFGDPETEALVPLIDNIDFFKLLQSASAGRLIKTGLLNVNKASVVVTLASKGYPGSYTKGITIFGLDSLLANDVHIFKAGVKKTDKGYQTSGGRVLMVCVVSNSLDNARKKVYKFITNKGVYFSGMEYRTDIGGRIR
ncbi:phosphoribosylamine--glycine ligase [Candidatus Gottesmanbacteria bacterium]|nr:phosphoribosylamine--glycine ligase [Candidatus Gottesmanbacteria bacterium]